MLKDKLVRIIYIQTCRSLIHLVNAPCVVYIQALNFILLPKSCQNKLPVVTLFLRCVVSRFLVKFVIFSV